MTKEPSGITRTPPEEQIRHYLSGNLCRCAAYPDIIEAVKLAAALMQGATSTDHEPQRHRDAESLCRSVRLQPDRGRMDRDNLSLNTGHRDTETQRFPMWRPLRLRETPQCHYGTLGKGDPPQEAQCDVVGNIGLLPRERMARIRTVAHWAPFTWRAHNRMRAGGAGRSASAATTRVLVVMPSSFANVLGDRVGCTGAFG